MKNTMAKSRLDDFDTLDDFYMPYIEYHGPCYNLQEVVKYCKANNRTADTLTDEELKPFITGWQ